MKRAPFWQRWRARYHLGTELEIWYDPESVVESLVNTYRVSGVQADRAELTLGTLAAEGLLDAGALRRPGLASAEDLLGFHTSAYLDETTDASILGRIFGLEPGGLPVEEILRAQRRAVGGTIAAALSVAEGRRPRVAFHVAGGFHHAEPERGSGFCVFNDVGVAIARLRREGFSAPIAIVDLDFHQGNGNLVAYARDATVLTYDLHGATWSHVEALADVRLLMPAGTDDRAYLARLDETLRPALHAHRPALVFYVAGNDVLAGDRLGSFQLSVAGVLERDRRVADAVREVGASMVVTLGGGYSPAAWSCSANFLRWLLCGVARTPSPATLDLRAHYERIAHGIDPKALRAGESDSLSLDLGDLFEGMGQPRQSSRLLLDYYTPAGVEFALERYGILRKIRERGYRELKVELDVSDRDRQLLRIRGRKYATSMEAAVANALSRLRSPPWRRTGEPAHAGTHTLLAPEQLLMELAVRKRIERAPAGMAADEPLQLLGLEWLMLQDPTAEFTLERPPMPGQEFPGLGIAFEIQELMVRVCHRLKLEGVWHRPAHYHVARVGAHHFRFVDPNVQGSFLALRHLLDSRDLAEATRWVGEGRVRLRDGVQLRWEPEEMILAVSPRVRAYFEGEAYQSAAAQARDALLAAGLELHIPPPRS